MIANHSRSLSTCSHAAFLPLDVLSRQPAFCCAAAVCPANFVAAQRLHIMHHAGAGGKEHSSESHFQSFTGIYIVIMADVQFPGSCLGFPVDHRLEPLSSTGLPTPEPFVGGHARTIENYGRLLQKHQVVISD